MELPKTDQAFDEGLAEILNNDVRGRSLQHLGFVAMDIVTKGLSAAMQHPQATVVSELRRALSRDLIEAFAGDTEFSMGREIEIGDGAVYLLQDSMTNYFVLQRLGPQQKLVGTINTIVAIDTVRLSDYHRKIGKQIRLGGYALPDSPALLQDDLQFITAEGKAHRLKPTMRALIPLNMPDVTHPRVAVPRERNARV